MEVEVRQWILHPRDYLNSRDQKLSLNSIGLLVSFPYMRWSPASRGNQMLQSTISQPMSLPKRLDHCYSKKAEI